jgi:hypothetical protein
VCQVYEGLPGASIQAAGFPAGKSSATSVERRCQRIGNSFGA